MRISPVLTTRYCKDSSAHEVVGDMFAKVSIHRIRILSSTMRISPVLTTRDVKNVSVYEDNQSSVSKASVLVCES